MNVCVCVQGNRQVRQTQNVDVHVDVESHPVGSSAPLNQFTIGQKFLICSMHIK